MAEASDFKFGTQLGFAKTHHEIPHGRKSGRGPGLEDLPKILGFPCNICATTEASNFKFGMHLCLPRTTIKTTARGKVGEAVGYGNSQIFGVPV